MQLLLVVGQNPNDNKVFGYQVSKPMFGTLSPRKLIDGTDVLIDSLEVNIESGDIKVMCVQPVFGLEITLITETGITVIIQYDGAAGGYISTGELAFAQHIASHIDGVCNLKAIPFTNEATMTKTEEKPKKKKKSKAKKD